MTKAEIARKTRLGAVKIRQESVQYRGEYPPALGVHKTPDSCPDIIILRKKDGKQYALVSTVFLPK